MAVIYKNDYNAKSDTSSRGLKKRRSEIAADAKATLETVKQGKTKKGGVEDLIADLLDDDDY